LKEPLIPVQFKTPSISRVPAVWVKVLEPPEMVRVLVAAMLKAALLA